jgi:tRNA-dihydrouridine synthase
MIEATGCDGVMLARGALGNPWIYREVQAALAGTELPAAPSIAERASVLGEHFGYLRELYGDKHACLRVRRVVSWYIVAVVGGSELRVRAFKVETPAEAEAIIADFAKSEPADKEEREAARIAEEAA